MPNKNLEFDKAIVKYFMDFLETDFHKRSIPKRKIVYTNSENLTVGCSLKKYPKIEEKIEKLLNENNGLTSLTIKKGDYVSPIKITSINKMKDLIKDSCNTRVKEINKSFIDELDKKIKTKKSSDAVLINESVDDLKNQVELLIINKFFEENIGYLYNVGIQEQDIITIKESIVNSFESYFNDKLIEAFEELRNNKNKSIKNYIDFINIDSTINIIIDYFINYTVSDLYIELSKMNATKKIMDKQEFYLSLYDITYNKNKYPLFYIPFDVEEQDNKYLLSFDAQMYINKKSIEYIIQELKEKMKLTGKIDSIAERIIYLAELENPNQIIKKVLNEIINYFSFNDELTKQNAVLKNQYISISNSFYFNIFDKSDDALVNDYEELLQFLNSEDSKISLLFQKIIEQFMTRNPDTITNEVNEDWDNQELSDKLVFKAPIPLNEEQIKILNALKNEKCKYVTVQGPPGTGKSHTITAIVFDMILKNKSVLVLSDKKEALDVVEDKITSTLDSARVEDDFQNPILRLGKTGSTYSQILSTTSIDNIRNSYKVLSKKSAEIEKKIDQYCETIKDDIDFEQLAYEKIKLQDILEYQQLENDYNLFSENINIEEIASNNSSLDDVQEDIVKVFDLIDIFTSNETLDYISNLADLYNCEIDRYHYSRKDLLDLQNNIKKYKELIEFFESISETIRDDILKFGLVSNDIFKKVENIVNEYNIQNAKPFKFLFKKKMKNNILSDLKNIYKNFDLDNYELEINSINDVIKARDYINNDIYDIVVKLLKENTLEENYKKINELINNIDTLKQLVTIYPKNFGKLVFSDLYNINKDISKVSLDDYNLVIRYLFLKEKITKDFSEISLSKYNSYKSVLQSLVTLKTTNILDGRVIDFYENNIATAKLLRKIIQKKQKFPKKDFEKLKNAFPCILAGIRDYAEYIPLEPEIFDLIIIDEASQVSIAQALPALIRAKKVLVLGDKKQFSNVKSNQARIEINNEYKNVLKSSYMKSDFYNKDYMLKLENFDIKSSVLDFFESISNYQTMLYKYFRGYKEIISYSNRYFYDDKLQVMKIRGKPIDDVIKFHQIKHDGKLEFAPKTNKLECEYIISELKKLLQSSFKGSVGIITPHTNQQRLIFSEVKKLAEYRDLDKRFNLKIMTFDSCQGEERDIIYYSMVANPTADSLWGVFPKDLKNLNLEEDGNLRAQRLNVGFSRPKECMHFVISKSLDEFTGEIGNALRHYNNILEISKKEKSAEETDKKSPMEPKVMDWFYKTDFWSKHYRNIEFQPQFELGKYLKQLDPYYNHPLYCVDFLVLFDDIRKTHKIIIEYDGFKEHFNELMEVDINNYNDYYKDEDIYRQKVLESYGYKFIRINKFNVGDNPIKTLNDRLVELVNEKDTYEETFKDKITSQVQDLNNGRKKECPKCKRILDIEEFKDSNLVSGIGKICKECKSTNSLHKHKSTLKKEKNLTNRCPICGRQLTIRTGRYGRFYGCTGYPYCKYTKSI